MNKRLLLIKSLGEPGWQYVWISSVLQCFYHSIHHYHCLFSCDIFVRSQISFAVTFHHSEGFKRFYFIDVRIILAKFYPNIVFYALLFEVIMSLDSVALLSLSLVLIKITHFCRSVRIQVKDATVKQSHFYFRTHKNNGLIEPPGIHKQGLWNF
jgi:hypothetical protein